MPISAPLNVTKPEAKKEFDPLPEDVYEVSIKDVEHRQSKFTDEKTGEPKMELNFTFNVLDQNFKNRLLWRSVSPYVSEPGAKKPSLLTVLSSAALGHTLTFEESERFYKDSQGFLNDLIGKRLRVTVVQKASSSGKVFSNVAGFLKAKDTDGIPF